MSFLQALASEIPSGGWVVQAPKSIDFSPFFIVGEWSGADARPLRLIITWTCCFGLNPDNADLLIHIKKDDKQTQRSGKPWAVTDFQSNFIEFDNLQCYLGRILYQPVRNGCAIKQTSLCPAGDVEQDLPIDTRIPVSDVRTQLEYWVNVAESVIGTITDFLPFDGRLLCGIEKFNQGEETPSFSLGIWSGKTLPITKGIHPATDLHPGETEVLATFDQANFSFLSSPQFLAEDELTGLNFPDITLPIQAIIPLDYYQEILDVHHLESYPVESFFVGYSTDFFYEEEELLDASLDNCSRILTNMRPVYLMAPYIENTVKFWQGRSLFGWLIKDCGYLFGEFQARHDRKTFLSPNRLDWNDLTEGNLGSTISPVQTTWAGMMYIESTYPIIKHDDTGYYWKFNKPWMSNISPDTTNTRYVQHAADEWVKVFDSYELEFTEVSVNDGWLYYWSEVSIGANLEHSLTSGDDNACGLGPPFRIDSPVFQPPKGLVDLQTPPEQCAYTFDVTIEFALPLEVKDVRGVDVEYEVPLSWTTEVTFYAPPDSEWELAILAEVNTRILNFIFGGIGNLATAELKLGGRTKLSLTVPGPSISYEFKSIDCS